MTWEEARRASLEHWRRMRRAPFTCRESGEMPGPGDCALCCKSDWCRLRSAPWGATVDDYTRSLCGHCPIQRVTGRGGCVGTPYLHAFRTWDSLHSAFVLAEGEPEDCIDALVAWRRAAAEEMWFLDSEELKDMCREMDATVEAD